MYKLELTKEQKILLNLTARSISDTPSDLVLPETELQDADWKAIVKESVAQTVPLATFDRATVYKNHIPEDVYAQWKNIAMGVLRSDFGVVQSQADLVELLGDKYPYLIIKGTAAGAYYPDPELRALGDVDFLIDPAEQDELEALLVKEGYAKSNGDHPNHIVFKKPGAHLEMHFEVAGVPYGWQGEEVRAFLKNAVFEPVQRTQDVSTFHMPNDTYHGLILLLHMQHHMLGEGFGLRHLSDWAAYVARTYEKPFWTETLVPFLKKIGLFTYTAVMTKTSAKYLCVPCPDWAKDADEETCDEIMHDILTGGNFGRKDENRAKSGMLISERGKGGTKHGALYNLAHSLHKAVLRQYPIVKKVWIFYPFVYAYKALRFLFLSMIGKRPSLVKMAPEAEKRKSVYDKLAVFEADEPPVQ
ncbi:MAG: nucleotidyltransferase family protein [Clostridia bacterium]|nr:nucleotidyltransferase family protein [Clostridia bacterium]